MQEISKDILDKAALGDMQAFEEVYKATSSFVYNVALRVVNNREDAQEVVQEIFMTIYHKLKEFRHESSFKTWVYRITTNQAINYAKKNSRRQTVAYEESWGEQSVDSDVHLKMDQEENSQKVEQLLAVLNPDQRACVVLRELQGLSYEAIAETLGTNINTVRTRLKRAREKMLNLKGSVDYEKV